MAMFTENNKSAQVGFGYDSVGRLSSLTRTANWDYSTTINTSYTLDLLDRVTSITHSKVIGEDAGTLSQFTYSYDANSRVVASGEDPQWYSVDCAAWVPAETLRRGELLMNAEGATVRVEHVSESRTGLVDFYNIEVEELHTFFVDHTQQSSALIHNGQGNYIKSPLNATQAQRNIASLKRRTAEHQKKLSDYLANPHAFDHKGFLMNAPTPEIRQSIIDGRARHLQGEIDNFNKKIAVLRGLLGGG